MKSLTPIIIPLLLLTSCSIFQETWQGTLYKEGNTGGKPEYSPIFTDFTSCNDWTKNKATLNDKYTCNKNCKNIGTNDIQECELVIRNWTLNEGTITFDTYKK